MNKFPPIVKYTQKAFTIEEVNDNNGELTFYFELPIGKTLLDTEVIKYKIISQESGRSIFTADAYRLADIDNGILKSCQLNLKESEQLKVEAGKIYKIQIAFYNSESQEQSEWSIISYVKCTNRPTMSINGEHNDFTINNTTIQGVQTVESPTFFGVYSNTDITEPEKEYRFSLMYTTTRELIEQTDWKSHRADSGDSYVFQNILKDFTQYTVKYEIKTINGYEAQVSYNFLTSFFLVDSNIQLSLKPKLERDLGAIAVYIKGVNNTAANYILRRTSSESNYTIWEDVKYIQVLNKIPDETYFDYTVKCGVSYKYGIQQVNETGYRTRMITSDVVKCYFDDIFLISKNEMVKIKFNPKVTNYKRNLLETKQDTIGRQYPFIMKNGNTNYFSFSLGGLISYHAEFNNDFLNREKTKTAISDEELTNTVTTNLTDANLYNERLYREKVEKFLTNGEIKLFKSPTEGNLLIYLMQVSLTPEDRLGRLLYSFTSTAYEVDSSDKLANLFDNNIITLGEYVNVVNMGTQDVNFYYQGTFTDSAFNIIELIDNYNQITHNYGSYSRQLQYISSINFLVYAGRGSALFTINGMSVFIDNKGYSLHDIINITEIELLNGQNDKVEVEIFGTAKTYFVESETEDTQSPDMTVYSPVTSIGQFFEHTFYKNGNDNLSLNLAEAIEYTYRQQEPYINKFYSLSYLSIRSNQKDPISYSINNQPSLILLEGEEKTYNFPITSFVFDDTAKVTLNFIFNGYKR